jgi:methionyl-tRNA formyltransferase
MTPGRARTIFFGTPEFAVPVLEALAAHTDVVRVICQPDRPSGRGMKLQPPPVKQRALALGLAVEQPIKVRTRAFAAELAALEAELGVVVAYGRILPRAVLEAPRLGCVNLHASLLPRHRGAAPIQWSIAEGDPVTGVCLMQMDEGLDTGPVLARAELPIEPNETAGELTPRVSRLAADLLAASLPALLRGGLPAVPQDHAAATLAPLLDKHHGQVDWSQPAARVHDRIRAMHPWPGAYTFLDAARLKLHRAHVVEAEGQHAVAGTVLRADRNGLHVACGRGVIGIDELQLDGKRRMGAVEYLAGHILEPGARLHGETR